MKRRLLIVIIALIASVGCAMLTYPKIIYFLEVRAKVLENTEVIKENEELLFLLEEQFRETRGAEAPRTLKEAINYIMELDDVEVVQLQSYLENGDGVEYIEPVTNMTYATLCDGFEIELDVTNFDRLIQHLDDSGLTFHSADFLFGARKAILRVRLGGVYSG